MIKSAYRLAKHGTADLPIQVRSTGYYRVWDGWRDLAIRKNFLELFWCVSGSGEFTLEDGTSLILQADQCCCYFPGDCHRIQALNKFEYYWITFDGPGCAELIKTFSLERKGDIYANPIDTIHKDLLHKQDTFYIGGDFSAYPLSFRGG